MEIKLNEMKLNKINMLMKQSSIIGCHRKKKKKIVIV